MVIVIIITVEAVVVDPAHWAVDVLQPWIQTQEHQKKPAESEEEERDEEARNYRKDYK